MANKPKSDYPVAASELHQADIQRGKRLREFRMSLTNSVVSMREMAEIITRKGYPCTKERYRAWELGHNVPGRVAVILYEMGLDLNWLYAGAKARSKIKKLK